MQPNYIKLNWQNKDNCVSNCSIVVSTKTNPVIQKIYIKMIQIVYIFMIQIYKQLGPTFHK